MGRGDMGEVEPTNDPLASVLPDPSVLAGLVGYLDQTVMVVRRDWSVAADLGPPGGILGYGSAAGQHPFSSLHPDEVERVSAAAQEIMESQPGARHDMEVTLQRADGGFGRFAVTLHNRFDHPELAGVVVVCRPLREIGQVRTAPLTASQTAPLTERDRGVDVAIETLGAHLPIGLVLLDSGGDLVYANSTALDLLDTDVDTLTKGEVPASIAAVDRDEILRILHRLRTSPGRESIICASLGAEHRLLSGTFVSRAASGSEGAVQFVIVTVEDVTHRLARERHLEHRANHDSLTGLPNRAWLLDHLHERLAAALPTLVAYIDLDGFKAVNDRSGHAAGDDMLIEVATAVSSSLAAGERMARVGGDEFVVVSATVQTADDLRGRIRAAVAGLDSAVSEQVGVSIGFASARAGDQPWDLLGRADEAMYGDKRRNDAPGT